MNIQITDQFTDFLCSFSNLTNTAIVVKLLKWASENPKKANEIMNAFAKLNTTSKRDFSLRLLNVGLEVPAGERRVYLFYTPILIHHQLIQEMERMKTHIEQNLSSIVYDGHIYVPTERAGQILLNAVEKNVAPNLIALIDQK